ncbi:MAG: protein kinase [Lentisphaeraceae bacterium]|nr:protein kinase [Lentisphaeraceae bacterium]
MKHEHSNQELSALFRQAQALSEELPDLEESIKSQRQRYLDPVLVDRGGMKEIFQVEDSSTGRLVAMACIHPQLRKKNNAAFLREGRISAFLQHPNIIPVDDMGIKDEGRAFFTMKLIEGSTLAEFLFDNDKRKSLNELVGILKKCCDAISFAHAQGVFHLDLKPQNILIGNYGEVLIVDWGLAQLSDEAVEGDSLLDDVSLQAVEIAQGCTVAKLKGTPGYMPPEAFEGECGSHSDIYALGAILYNILSAQPLFDSDELQRQIDERRTAFPVPPSRRSPHLNVPVSLEAVCLKALQPLKEQRYKSVVDMKAELDAYLGGFATTAESAGILTQFKLLFLRNKRFCLTLGSSFLLVFILTGIFVLTLQDKNVMLVQKEQGIRTIYNSYKELQDAQNKNSATEIARRAREMWVQGQDYQELVKQALLLDSSNEKTLVLKAEVAFASADYKQAIEYYKKSLSKGVEQQIKWAEKCLAEMELNGTISLNFFSEMLAAFYGQGRMTITNALASAYLVRQSVEEQPAVFEKFFRLQNKAQADFVFRYDPATRTLDLSSYNKLKNFSLLGSLAIKGLDLEASSIKRLREIYRLPIIRLNIKNTAIEDPVVLLKMKQLDRIVVSKGTLSKYLAGILRRRCTLIEE